MGVTEAAVERQRGAEGMVMVSSEQVSEQHRGGRSANLLQASSVLPGAEVFVVALKKVPDLCCAESKDDFYHGGLWLKIYLEDVKNQTHLALIYVIMWLCLLL